MSTTVSAISAEMEARADAEIAKGVAMVALSSLAPAPFSLGAWIATVGLTTNSIADAYQVYDSKRDNIGERVVSILFSGGAGWLISAGGLQLFSALLDLTGIGYLVGVAIRATTGMAMAYAVGQGAKGYYRAKANGHDLSNDELGQIVRDSYSQAQASKIADRVKSEINGRDLSEDELTEVIKKAIKEDKE